MAASPEITDVTNSNEKREEERIQSNRIASGSGSSLQPLLRKTSSLKIGPSGVGKSKARLARDVSRESSQATLQLPSISAAHLPFDILCDIFHQYEKYQHLQDELEPSTLETLLLVCKSWAYAAQNHPNLWSRFSIFIHKMRDLDIWRGRVRRHLRLCGPTRPLDVTVHLMLSSHGPLTENDMEWIEDVLRPLVGPNGEVASRWQDVEIFEECDIGFQWDSILAKYLVYPTPLLRSLRLRNVFSEQPLLPFTPALEIFRDSSKPSWSPSLTDLSTVKKAEVNSSTMLKDLKSSTYLTHLTLRLDDKFRGTFPHLHHLEVVGNIAEWLDGFAAPHLRSVHVRSPYADSLAILATLPGIPQDKIEEVNIYLSSRAIHHPETCREAAQKLLASLRSLKVLELNQDAEGIILKLLVTDGHDLLRNQPCTIKTSSRTFQMVPEEDRSTLFGRVYSVDPSVFQGRWEDLSDLYNAVGIHRIPWHPYQ